MRIKRVAAAAILFPLALVLILTGCPDTDRFADLVGVNLIEPHPFGDGAGTSEWLVDTVADNPAFSYLAFEEASVAAAAAAGTDGLPAAGSSAVYRLELLNLFPNGDFEATPEGDTPDGWTLDALTAAVASASSSSIPVSIGDPDAEPIEGLSMFYKVDSASLISFDFQNSDPTLSLSDGFISNALYVIRADFRFAKGNIFILEYSDGSIGGIKRTWEVRPLLGSETGIFSFPGDFIIDDGILDSEITADSTATSFSINSLVSGEIHGSVIDNIRVVRSDPTHRLRFKVPYREAGRPDLVDGGTYRFSIYVHEDPTHHHGEASLAVSNRFIAAAVTIGLNTVSADGTFAGAEQAFEVFSEASAGEWSSSWTLISHDFPVQFEKPAAGNEDAFVLELTVCPANLSGGFHSIDSGSLLISSPFLEYIPVP